MTQSSRAVQVRSHGLVRHPEGKGPGAQRPRQLIIDRESSATGQIRTPGMISRRRPFPFRHTRHDRDDSAAPRLNAQPVR